MRIHLPAMLALAVLVLLGACDGYVQPAATPAPAPETDDGGNGGY